MALVGLALTVFASSAAATGEVGIFPEDGYSLDSYTDIATVIRAHRSDAGEICFVHGQGGVRRLLLTLAARSSCEAGIVVYGWVLDRKQTVQIGHDRNVLTVAGDLDGVSRFSSFAAAIVVNQHVQKHRFVAVSGATHHSVINTQEKVASTLSGTDLLAEVPNQVVHKEIGRIVGDWCSNNEGLSLKAGESIAAQLAAPVIEALKMEGSSQLGSPLCNSDFPTNPTCKYPKWPDHSLPPGPKPAPNPALPTDCVCGSPWVEQVASPVMAGFNGSAEPTTRVASNDAFHDVSDTHPFHLPHIFNSCPAGDHSCILNITTVTMPILKAGDLFPNASSPPLSAFELRTKLKSREASWEAAGLGKQNGKQLDGNLSMCRSVNEKAWQWALDHADPLVVMRFKEHGDPMVMVDDKVAAIGVSGPEWIQDELVYTQVNGSVEVQSWQFVVPNTNQGNDPWFFPVGMHYCKLLSPARAMEWIYLDGLRRTRAA